MSTIKTLGPVGFNPIGEYNNSKKYERLDVVLYQGTSYVALKESLNQTPTNTEYWDCLGISGADISNYYTKNETNNLLDGKQPLIDNDNKLPYSLISGTPTIPSKTSDLNNDSGYITKSVNNLENYTTTTNLNTALGNKLDSSKVVNATSTTAGETYDVRYINSIIGDINTALDTINGEVI